MKKLLSFSLVLVLFLGILSPAFASEETPSSAIHADIADSLSDVEQNKDLLGLTDVDFYNLSVGNAVRMYEYSSDSFIALRDCYPLFYQDNIVALAIDIGGGKYQITVNLARLIDELQITSLAIIYDRTSVYAYDGNSLHLLKTNPVEIETRCSLASEAILSSTTIDIVDLGFYSPLVYTPNTNVNARSDVMASCSMSIVTQNPYENICWAAVIASIVNSRKGMSLTAVDVAKYQHGPYFDLSLGEQQIINVLAHYGLAGYKFKNSSFLDVGIIFDNLSSGYPIFGGFTSPRGYAHAATIFLVHKFDGYIMIMDPLESSYQYCYYSSDGFSYYSSSIGEYLFLTSAACENWS